MLSAAGRKKVNEKGAKGKAELRRVLTFQKLCDSQWEVKKYRKK